jgi:hypothetical protein
MIGQNSWDHIDPRDLPPMLCGGGHLSHRGRNAYAERVPSNEKWIVALCSQKVSGLPLYKLEKSMGRKSIEEMALPKKAFAVIPISDIFDRITKKLSELLGEMKTQRG